MRTSRTFPVMAGAIAVAVVVSVFSSASSAAERGLSAQRSAAHSPIKIMTIGVVDSQIISLPEAFSGEEAAVKVINANGGVDGRQLQLTTCDTGFNPNKEVACLQKAVSEKVTAVTGSYLFFPGDLKILKAAGIAYFGGTGDIPDEAVSPISFPIPTQVSEDYGLAGILAKAGDKSVAITDSNSSSAEAQLNVNGALKRLGKAPLTLVSGDSGLPSYAAAVATAVGDKPTGLTTFEALPDVPKVLSAISQSGFSKPVALVAGATSPAILKAAGSSADGVKLASGVMPVSNTANPYVKAFLAAMKRYEPSAAVDGFSETAYAVVQLFAKVASTVKGAITPASFIRAGNAVTRPINVGLVPPWRGGGPAPIASEPRFKTYGYVPSVIKNDVVVAQGGFVNPFAKS